MRVVIAEDCVLLREGIARLLEESGFEIAGQAGDAEDLLRKVGAHKPDIAGRRRTHAAASPPALRPRTGAGGAPRGANRLLARNGMAYERDEHGDIVCLAPPAIREQLQRELPSTRDEALDELLGLAIVKYPDPDADAP